MKVKCIQCVSRLLDKCQLHELTERYEINVENLVAFLRTKQEKKNIISKNSY